MNTQELSALASVRGLSRSGAARSIRLAAGLSLPEVAEACGVAACTVYRWERGQRAPRGEPALRYAALLGSLIGGKR